MVSIKYNSDQLGKFLRDLSGLTNGFRKQVTMVIFDSLLGVVDLAKRPGYVPYKTGTLKKSITFALNPNGKDIVGYVGSNLDYAAIQEFGGDTGRNKKTHIVGKFYLTRAIKDNEEKIAKRWKALQMIKNR